MSRLVLHDTNLFDPQTLKLKPNQTIVMVGNKIAWVDDSSKFEKEEGDKILDLSDHYTIPGMMDLHVHLEFKHSFVFNREKDLLRHKTPYWSYLALKHAQEYLKYGFTTVRGCGSMSTALSSLRTLFEQNVFSGPRLFVAQKTVVQYGNQEAFGPEEWLKHTKPESGYSGVDEVIRAVRDRKRDGSDHIKTTTTGGVLHGKESDVSRSLWTDDELCAMVGEAERLGMYVAAHAHHDAGIYSAIKAGVRTIEHGTMISEESIKLMKTKGSFLVPTQSAGTFIHYADETIRASLPPEVRDKWEQVSSYMIEHHKIAFEKGVKIALGTDAPVAREHSHSPFELELMVKNIGMSPAQALQAATLVSAKAIKREALLGSIEPGKLADAVVLKSNPLQDIRVFQDLNNISHVIKDGVIR